MCLRSSAPLRLGPLALLLCIAAVSAQAPFPASRAERTNFEETSTYEDVRLFLATLAGQTSRIRLESFGKSEEGRELPLVLIGDPPAPSPAAARSSGRPVVLVIANIHGGEVDGKEALLHLTRRLTRGDLQHRLEDAVWLFAPIYNADGNERITTSNRPEQQGPIGGVGIRENASGLDLNRDFTKLDSAESRALVALLSRWDPDVVIDLHTTNGSYHGYHLTFAPTLTPNADARIISFTRNRLLPAVRREMALRHGFRTYYYGNFATAEATDEEQTTPEIRPGGTPIWRTFDHRPRFGTNYIGLRNRIAILSETYSYLDFAARVKATEAFVEEVMKFVALNAGDVKLAAGFADAASPPELGIAFELRPLPEPVEILVGAVEKKVNPRSGRAMTAMVESTATPVRVPDYGVFAPTEARRVPREYVVAADGNGLHEAVARKLKEHGVSVEILPAETTMAVEQFVVDRVRQAERVFQGHREVSVTGRFARRSIAVPGGSIVVPTAQPLRRLVFYLLEPESNDGLTTWNAFDTALKPGAPHPVLKSVP